jgi:histone-lysine N-methyltransferase SETMAR
MALELSREQFRTMILYGWKIGLNYRESHARLVAAWGDQASSDRTVLNWFHEYERGKLDVSDAPRSGRPRTAVSDEMIDAVRLLIEDDPHTTYQQIECSLEISSPAICSILHDHLKLRRVCARCVPHQLTNDQKRLRIQFCRESLQKI